jgi:hypothetical protein
MDNEERREVQELSHFPSAFPERIQFYGIAHASHKQQCAERSCE